MSLPHTFLNARGMPAAAGGGGGGGITPSYSIVDGNCFDMTLIPLGSDSYTLSQLGSADVTGSWSSSYANRYFGSDWVRILINGQGRGCTGTGGSGLSSTNFQLVANTTGNGSFTYSGYNDAFQPGTPHECGFFWSRPTSPTGTIYTIGGANETSSIGGTNSNGTVRGWTRSTGDAFTNNTRVILLGNTTAGHVVFQYQIFNGTSGTNTSGQVVRMLHQYTNTTGSSRWVSFQRGGDVDFNAYSTTNTRVSGDLLTHSRGNSNNQTLGVYLPANGTDGISGTPTRTTLISDTFTKFSPETMAAGTGARANGNADTSIYMAANWGEVLAGETVYACGYYVYGTTVSNMQSQIV
jgi:hypothetical protein